MAMLFEVVGPDKRLKMGTDYIFLIPWDDISSLHSFGYTFRYNGKSISKNQLMSIRTNDKSGSNIDTEYTSRSVICVETGRRYKTQSEAAKDIGIDPAQVSDSIKTGRPRSGYTFRRVI